MLDGYMERYRNQTTPGARPVQVHLDAFPLVGGQESPPVSVAQRRLEQWREQDG